jgi:endoglucanase
MSFPSLLDELLRAPGPTGREDAVAAVVRREAAAFGAEVEHDVLGSTVARVRGTAGGRLLALFAHVDQIGMIVTHVDEGGYLAVGKLANWDASSALGQRVTVIGRAGDVTGVVTRTGEGDVSWSDLRVDVGAADRDAALSLVAPGDPAVLAAPPVELAGGRIVSGALDDRAGLYAALEALRRLAADPPGWDVALVATTQEETSVSGAARAVAERLRPDVVVVAEATFASDAPRPDPPAWGDVRLGAGPVVFRGAVVHPLVAEGLVSVAQATNMPIAIEAGAATWSDADDVFTAAGGIPVGCVAIPLRYMHSAAEVAQLSDVDALSRLLEAYARSLTVDISFER